jgi:hypothetical protein
MDEDSIAARYRTAQERLNERQRRLWAGAEVRSSGGGRAAVARATGLSPDTVRRGILELEVGDALDSTRVRRPGGGRKPLSASDPTLLSDLDRLMDGDAGGPVSWTTSSVRDLAVALHGMGHAIHYTTLSTLLGRLGYTSRSSRRSKDGAGRRESDGQLRYITAQITNALARREPVIIVELRAHGVAGGFETVGVSNDTAGCAVAAIAEWWRRSGSKDHPAGATLTLIADGAGLPGTRTRRWLIDSQRFADQSGLTLAIHHLPPATTRWNTVEQRVVMRVPPGWRSPAAVAQGVILSRIGAAPVPTGPDTCEHPLRQDWEEVGSPDLDVKPDRHAFRPDWNYALQRR